jgi:hypothetical protein
MNNNKPLRLHTDGEIFDLLNLVPRVLKCYYDNSVNATSNETILNNTEHK